MLNRRFDSFTGCVKKEEHGSGKYGLVIKYADGSMTTTWYKKESDRDSAYGYRVSSKKRRMAAGGQDHEISKTKRLFG